MQQMLQSCQIGPIRPRMFVNIPLRRSTSLPMRPIPLVGPKVARRTVPWTRASATAGPSESRTPTNGVANAAKQLLGVTVLAIAALAATVLRGRITSPIVPPLLPTIQQPRDTTPTATTTTSGGRASEITPASGYDTLSDYDTLCGDDTLGGGDTLGESEPHWVASETALTQDEPTTAASAAVRTAITGSGTPATAVSQSSAAEDECTAAADGAGTTASGSATPAAAVGQRRSGIVLPVLRVATVPIRLLDMLLFPDVEITGSQPMTHPTTSSRSRGTVTATPSLEDTAVVEAASSNSAAPNQVGILQAGTLDNIPAQSCGIAGSGGLDQAASPGPRFEQLTPQITTALQFLQQRAAAGVASGAAVITAAFTMHRTTYCLGFLLGFLVGGFAGGKAPHAVPGCEPASSADTCSSSVLDPSAGSGSSESHDAQDPSGSARNSSEALTAAVAAAQGLIDSAQPLSHAAAAAATIASNCGNVDVASIRNLAAKLYAAAEKAKAAAEAALIQEPADIDTAALIQGASRYAETAETFCVFDLASSKLKIQLASADDHLARWEFASAGCAFDAVDSIAVAAAVTAAGLRDRLVAASAAAGSAGADVADLASSSSSSSEPKRLPPGSTMDHKQVLTAAVAAAPDVVEAAEPLQHATESIAEAFTLCDVTLADLESVRGLVANFDAAAEESKVAAAVLLQTAVGAGTEAQVPGLKEVLRKTHGILESWEELSSFSKIRLARAHDYLADRDYELAEHAFDDVKVSASVASETAAELKRTLVAAAAGNAAAASADIASSSSSSVDHDPVGSARDSSEALTAAVATALAAAQGAIDAAECLGCAAADAVLLLPTVHKRGTSDTTSIRDVATKFDAATAQAKAAAAALNQTAAGDKAAQGPELRAALLSAVFVCPVLEHSSNADQLAKSAHDLADCNCDLAEQIFIEIEDNTALVISAATTFRDRLVAAAAAAAGSAAEPRC